MAQALQFDRCNACLWQGNSEIRLSPKALSVVEYLIDHTGEISTKEDLLNTVWANENVSEYALTSIIRDLRRALGDSTKHPRYIQTVHRRGYRWIAPVTTTNPTAPSTANPPTPSITAAKHRPPILTGRTTELQNLLQAFQNAAEGKRQVLFLSGEPGIGKTALLEAFASQIIHHPNCSMAIGQCTEKYGSGEAYQPILEALTRLCILPEGQKFIRILKQYAPSWLMQMPSLVPPGQLAALQKQGLAPKERWLRELAEALDIMARDQSIVLILEDLHWSDPATVEFLEQLARRQESAQLLVLASYRPVEIKTSNHPLQQIIQELELHALCQDIALKYLDPKAIEDYLVQRFPHQFSPANPPHDSGGNDPTIATIAAQLHLRTEGNPLFLINVVDSLIVNRSAPSDLHSIKTQNLSSMAVPKSLQQLINLQFDALDPTQQQILETASVEGVEFLSVTVAHNLNMDSEEVEACIDDLVQLKHLITINEVDILPDGTLSTRYRFIHALYQEGLYQRLSQNRRVRLHRALGIQLETIYSPDTNPLATQLALHFEEGMDYRKAIHYQQQAGENALRRNAHAAAVVHFQQGLILLSKIQGVTERHTLEISLQILLGTALMTIKGQAAPEVGKAYERAQKLCQNAPGKSDRHNADLFTVSLGFWRHAFICGDLRKSADLSQQCLALAEQNQDSAQLGNAHYALAGTLMYQGHLTQALKHTDAGLTHYRTLTLDQELAFRHSQDPSATLMAYRAWILFWLGSWEQARQAMDDMLALEIVQSHFQTKVSSLTYSGILDLYLKEFDRAQQQLQQAIQLAKEWSIPQFVTIAQFFLTHTLCLQDHHHHRLPEMEQALAIRRATGADLHATGYLNRIAEGYLAIGQPEAGLAILAQVPPLIRHHHEQIFEADTYRLMGELLLLPGASQNEAKAENFLLQSMTIAQQQNAKTFELRAALSLAHQWNKQGRTVEARNLLTPVHTSFNEGFQFHDLQGATQLLESV